MIETEDAAEPGDTVFARVLQHSAVLLDRRVPERGAS
jgi:hypothetical protein